MQSLLEPGVGELSILSVGDGDMRFNFNSKDPQETARAERVINDMLKRGYLLFVEHKGKLRRATAFDPKKCEWVIADGPTAQPASADETPPEDPIRRKRGRPAGVPAKSSKATAIAPTAGG